LPAVAGTGTALLLWQHCERKELAAASGSWQCRLNAAASWLRRPLIQYTGNQSAAHLLQALLVEAYALAVYGRRGEKLRSEITESGPLDLLAAHSASNSDKAGNSF
jgi:hypothetical protein